MYYRGVTGVFDDLDKFVLIVGSRKAKPEECGAAYALARKMAERGMIVVSGLADGVDTYAHRGALDAGGLTVGILANTPEKATYPKSNIDLAERIVDHGALLYPFITPQDETVSWGLNHFQRRLVERDCLQAILCKKIFAVSDSATITGGTRYAVNYGKNAKHDVYRFDTNFKSHANPPAANSGINWETEINLFDRDFQPWTGPVARGQLL